MPYFSERSKNRLYSCATPLIELAEYVIQYWDCTVLYGHRIEKVQNELYRKHKSKVMFPYSKHNRYPSEAIDLAPYDCWGEDRNKIVWPDYETKTFAKDLALWYYFGGFVMGAAQKMGIKIRHGADWDIDRMISDQKFDDLAHFELIKGG